MKLLLPKIGLSKIFIVVAIGLVGIGASMGYKYVSDLQAEKIKIIGQLGLTQNSLIEVTRSFDDLKNTDQIKINKDLQTQIGLVDKTFKESVGTYESMLDIQKRDDLDKQWAAILADLAKNDYQAAGDKLTKLKAAIDKVKADLAAVPIPANLPASNTPPSAGFAKQVVNVDGADFVVDIVSADLKSSKLIVDTASDGNCTDNCPVNSLDFYAKRSGAYAGINGPYFCPDTYPNCAGKKNSFDTLLMNKNKVYFNSDNNVYSTNPVAIFSTTSRFIDQGSGWGRDTGVDSVIMGRPLLVYNNSMTFNGNSDVKETSKGNRAFMAGTDALVYIGVVHNATVAEVAKVIVKMGIRNAINLDSGGSTAMWVNGKYVDGPGRGLPFGVLLVRR